MYPAQSFITPAPFNLPALEFLFDVRITQCFGKEEAQEILFGKHGFQNCLIL